jgi:hypothetical protein
MVPVSRDVRREVGHRVADDERLYVVHEGVGRGEKDAEVRVQTADDQLVAALRAQQSAQMAAQEGVLAHIRQ